VLTLIPIELPIPAYVNQRVLTFHDMISINLPSLVSVGSQTRLYVPSTDLGISIHVKELGMQLEFPALTAVNKQFYVHDAVLG
jgi:hypothetical protein